MLSNRLPPNLSRRDFLAATASTATLALAGSPLFAASPRPKVAAIFTELRFRSHAYNILENFFQPYLFRGKLVDPGVDVVSFYADQFPDNDMARDVSRRMGVPLFKTIDQALCLGGKELAVDAVLSIGEHGDYPFNELGQHLYPRKEFFDAALAVMQRSGRVVPLFNDKHLSYRFDWAKQMVDASVQHGFPLMAGSSVPLAQRRPPFELPADAEINEAVSIHGGGLESYDFHGLEVLQSIVEARRGGETGIERVELLTGDKLAEAQRQGRWSQELVRAAMSHEAQLADLRQPRPDRASEADIPPAKAQVEHALVLTYRDGLRASVLKVGSSSNRWNFACRLKGNSQIHSTSFFNSPWGNRGLFKALSHAIQTMFTQRKQPYPIQRTLLTGGVLDAAMHSHHQQGEPIDTPELSIAYQPIDYRALRENGDTWKIITRQTEQPTNFEPGDARFVQ
jgi:hypothetical protein